VPHAFGFVQMEKIAIFHLRCMPKKKKKKKKKKKRGDRIRKIPLRLFCLHRKSERERERERTRERTRLVG
jgi:hypothetical protein